jgi:hypothetical protein
VVPLWGPQALAPTLRLEPPLPVAILPTGDNHPGPHHGFDHPPQGCERDALACEVHNLGLGDTFALGVRGYDEVEDFVEGSGVSARSTSCEYIGHKGFCFQKPAHSSIEIFFCKKQNVTSISGRDHR